MHALTIYLSPPAARQPGTPRAGAKLIARFRSALISNQFMETAQKLARLCYHSTPNNASLTVQQPDRYQCRIHY